MSGPKVHRSKRFITEPVTAVFPHLNTPDKFGKFSIDVNVLDDPDFEQMIAKQVEETVAAGQDKLDTTATPSNSFVREGEYDGQPTRRIAFKMNSTKTVKGKEVKQAPRLVDSKKVPISEVIYGGSKVKIAYFIQYTITPNGCYATVKLDAVQVLEHVGPGGEVSIDELFDEEEGFTTHGEEETPEVPADMPPPNEHITGTAAAASEF